MPLGAFFLVLQQLDVCVLIPDSGAEWTDFFFCFALFFLFICCRLNPNIHAVYIDFRIKL